MLAPEEVMYFLKLVDSHRGASPSQRRIDGLRRLTGLIGILLFASLELISCCENVICSKDFTNLIVLNAIVRKASDAFMGSTSRFPLVFLSSTKVLLILLFCFRTI